MAQTTPDTTARLNDAIKAFRRQKQNPAARHALHAYNQQIVELRSKLGATAREIAAVLKEAGIETDEKKVTYYTTLLRKAEKLQTQ